MFYVQLSEDDNKDLDPLISHIKDVIEPGK